jgi:hypothetical protein
MAAWGTAAGLLLLPLVAMQFSDEVDWTVGDFVFAGLMIGSVGLALELTVSRTRSLAYRAAVGFALAAAFLLIWVNGAVGIIGSENEDANLMYFGVLAVGFVGTALAMLRPNGMVWAMTATAIAQALVGVGAVIAGLGTSGQIWPWDVLGATGFFTALWLIAAALFRKAAQEPPRG